MVLNARQGKQLGRDTVERLCVRGCFACAVCLMLLVFLHIEFGAATPVGGIVTTVLLLAVGFTAAPSYFLIPNLFAMEFAGDDCATLVGMFELAAFCSKMPAHMIILHVADEFGWDFAIVLLAGTAMTAGVTMNMLLCRWRALRAQGRCTRFSRQGSESDMSLMLDSPTSPSTDFTERMSSHSSFFEEAQSPKKATIIEEGGYVLHYAGAHQKLVTCAGNQGYGNSTRGP